MKGSHLFYSTYMSIRQEIDENDLYILKDFRHLLLMVLTVTDEATVLIYPSLSLSTVPLDGVIKS